MSTDRGRQTEASKRHPVLFAAAVGGFIAGIVLAILFKTWWMLAVSVGMFVGTALLAGILDTIEISRRRR